MISKEAILEMLSAHKPELSGFGVSALGLFGSYVRDEQTADSDIDLFIDFEPGKEALTITWPYARCWNKSFRTSG